MDSAVEKRMKRDLACGYLEVSVIYYKRFLVDYNSGVYGTTSISFAHLYKAWDSLFQSMLLLAGGKVRNDATENYPLGQIKGITDSFLNLVSQGKYTTKLKHSLMFENWEIEEFKEMVLSQKDFGNNEFFNSLDLLRHLRNASEHDFLEVGGGSYNGLIRRTNQFIIPLVEMYLKIYGDFQKKVIGNCLQSKFHDKGRGSFCSRRSLKKLSQKELEELTHFPFPLRMGTKDRSASVTSLINQVLSGSNFGFSKKGYKIKLDPSWYIEDASGVDLQSHLNEQFPYRSLKELAEKTGVNYRIISKKITLYNLKRNPLYILHLHSAENRVTTIYSKKLFELIKTWGKEN